MTRRRIIAGVILMAAVAVAVPLVPGVWERVAYQKEIYDAGGNFRCVILRQRWPWLPGDDAVFPEQLCGHCEGDMHNWCWDARSALLLRLMKAKFRSSFLNSVTSGDFRCTCTDPSHED